MNPLIQKLEQFQKLSDDEKRVLEAAITNVVEFGSREDIISDGERPECVHLLLTGWAARYKILSDGERQIMAYLIPGDLCDIHITLLDRMDHGIASLSRCEVGLIPRAKVDEIMTEHTQLARALFWATLVDEAILREWLVSIGRRSAEKRVAHLFCEMLLRLRAIGLTTDDSFELPLTQEELADTMGISSVHMNRTLQELRSADLITSKGRLLIINDAERLMEFSGFDPDYLHQREEKD
jgi:CRP-like cAMP-binding protein